MKSTISLIALALITAAPLTASADIITKWDFGTIGVQAAPYNAPAPTTGLGTAITLGMDNNYNGGNTANDDVVLTAGTANSAFKQNGWRIRGTTHNGWATNAAGAAQYTQGIELDVSTVGYENITFAFDWYSTKEGIRDLQFQYNLDITNPAGWVNYGGTSATGTYLATTKDWYSYNTPEISVDLSTISGASNDANFGIRLVSAFDSTGNIANDYASATLTGGKTTLYNNTSGNWQFANLTFSGTPVTTPEPASLTLLAFGTLGLLASRRK